MTKQDIYVGLFDNREDMTKAVEHLYTADFRSEQLSVLVSTKGASGHFGFEERPKVAEGATAGGAVGVGIGAIVGALVAVGAIAIPGVGLLAAGPLVAALAGAGATGAAGGLIGGFVGMGFSETEAKFFEDEVKRGNVLLAILCETEGEASTARRVLEMTHAKLVAA